MTFTGETWRILECTKKQEYLALSDEDKDWYKVLISAVTLDLSENSKAQNALWNMFPENTHTGKKLRDPANGLTPLPFVPNP